jgi:hypothetical protein
MVRIMTDPVRDQLWAAIYRIAAEKGRLWFQCAEEAEHAVKSYDRRSAEPTKEPNP